MKIEITNVEADLRSGMMQPTAVSFEVRGCGHQFKLRLDEERNLYVTNEHLRRKNKRGDSGIFSYEPIRFTPDDLPIFEEMIEHWKEIRPNFVQRISHGALYRGHISTTYKFPDGREVNYTVGDTREPKRTEGDSVDNKFLSNGCNYIEDIPEQQHYKHGNFDFYLEKAKVVVEDDEHTEVLEGEQPETVLELLRFVSMNSKTHLTNILGIVPALEKRL